MISIASLQFDPDGALLIARPGPGTRATDASRRVTRTATLDGGVSISDTGYSAGDRTVKAEVINPTPHQVEIAARLVRLYPLVTVCLSDGAYQAVPSSYDLDAGKLSITLLLVEQISG